jgi:hypothetical protein
MSGAVLSLRRSARDKMPATLPLLLFFSAIHFALFHDVFCALCAKAFAKPVFFIQPMANV